MAGSHLRTGRRARGGRSAVRGRHGRGGQAADLGATRRVRDRPPGRFDRGLGRRQLRPARRRPRGAPGAGRRPAPPAPPVEGRTGRGSSWRRRHRAGHDLPLRWHAGDLRGTACPRSAVLWVVGTTPIAGALARLGSAAGWRVTVIDPIAEPDAFPGRRPGPRLGRHPRPRPRRRPVRGRREPGHLGRGGGRARARPARRRTSGWSPRRRGPAVVRDWLREETTVAERAHRGVARPGRSRSRRRDGGGGRPVDPGRARPGPSGTGGFRRLARTGDGGRRPADIRSHSNPSSTISSSWIRSAG